MKLDLRQIWIFAVGCALALVPVLATNWFVSQVITESIDRHLDDELLVAGDTASQQISRLIEGLNQIAEASSVVCSQRTVERFRTLTIQSPAVSAAFTLDQDGAILCGSPQVNANDLNTYRDPVPLFDGQVFIANASLYTDRLTGLLLSIARGDLRYAVFMPRQVLPQLFSALDRETGVALTLGEIVLFARDPQLHDAVGRSDIETLSRPVVGGAMRVQVSIDRNAQEAYYSSIKLGATFVAVIVGALVVTLLTRLIRATPSGVNELEQAIEKDQFVPYYQPVFDLETGKLLGCEVLVRWAKPDGKLVPPGSFIGLAEQTGLAVPMTRRLMEAVVRDLQNDYAKRPNLKVAVNLFNQHFNSLDIIGDVQAIFGPSSISYSQLVLEITERAPLDSISQAKVIMRKLQRLGCRLALDDAGTGHGGLAYLQELGLDIVKIDKMFIDQLGKSRIGESITHTLTDLAAQLDMDVVAEGVERVEQVAHLKRYGIRQAQGYLFAPALPANQYLALVRKLGSAPTQSKPGAQEREAEDKAATLRAAARQLADTVDDAASAA